MASWDYNGIQDKGFFGNSYRKDSCATNYKDMDFAGRWLTNIAMHTLGYKSVITPELYAAGDDTYQSIDGGRTILTESRTNIRLWDKCIKANDNPNQWVRKGHGRSDLLLTWGACGPNSWIGNVCIGDDVRSSPIKSRGSVNANQKEGVYDVPWTKIKMILKVRKLNDKQLSVTMWDYRKVEIDTWSIDITPDNNATLDVKIPSKLYNIKYIPDESDPMGKLFATLNNIKGRN